MCCITPKGASSKRKANLTPDLAKLTFRQVI